MKPSKYNCYIPDDDKYIFFNCISQNFFYVSNKNAEKFRSIIETPNEFVNDFKDFISKMKSTGFVIDDCTDEYNLISSKYNFNRCPDEYHLMILPTYNCNLRCWYCTQKHQNIKISHELTEALKRNIDNAVAKPEIKKFTLSWFGGEPLMEYDIVLELTKYAKKKCEEFQKTFFCHITTNATLLTPERINCLNNAGVKMYQITIDGERSNHDSIKHLSKESSFDLILRNVVLITKSTDCTLRFNYTKDNLKPNEIIRDLTERLPEDSRKRIKFCIFKVWQENEDTINPQDVMNLFHNADAKHLNPQLQTFGMCYADKPNFYCVFPNGKVGKCDNHGINEVPGLLTLDGNINYPTELSYVKTAIDIGDNICISCKYLPVCWGPCVSKRRAMFENEGKIKCYLNNRDAEMTQLIKNYCKSIILRENCENKNI